MYVLARIFYAIINIMKNKGLSFRKRRRKKININIIKSIFGYLIWAGIGVMFALILSYAFGLRTNVIGVSMEPRISSSQHILLDRFVYVFKKPKVGEVVAFYPNGNENLHLYIKRIVAVPGDSIVIDNGILYVNGVKAKTGVEYDKIKDAGIISDTLKLNDGEYFVMGDNCNESEDSRSGNIGVVKKDYIYGKVWFKLSKNIRYIGLVR